MSKISEGELEDKDQAAEQRAGRGRRVVRKQASPQGQTERIRLSREERRSEDTEA